ALKAALCSPKLFYHKCKSFLETFYVDAQHRRSAIKTVALKNLITPDVEIALASIHGRDGNVTVYEKLAISSLIRHHKPKILLELGTFDGNTTLQMGLNTSADAVIHTLDLPPDFLRTKEPISKADLKYVTDTEKNVRKYQGTAVENKIIQHFGD